jgi:hypothetical protein
MKLLKLLDEIKIVPAERFPVEVGDIWDLEYASNKLAYVTQIKETPKNYRIFFEKVKFDEEGNIINRYTSDDLLDKGYFIASDSPYRFKKRVERIEDNFLSHKRFYFNDYISKFRDKEKLDFFTFRELVNNLDLPKEQYDSIAKKAIELIKKIQKANVREEAEVYANEKYEQYKNALKNLSQQIPADFSILSDLLNEIKIKPAPQPLKIYYTVFLDSELLIELEFRSEDKYFKIGDWDFPINYDESADILGFLTTDSNLVDFLKGLGEEYGIEVDEVLDLGDVKIKNISTNPNIIFKVKYY